MSLTRDMRGVVLPQAGWFFIPLAGLSMTYHVFRSDSQSSCAGVGESSDDGNAGSSSTNRECADAPATSKFSIPCSIF